MAAVVSRPKEEQETEGRMKKKKKAGD